MADLKLHENIFIETNLLSLDYDGVIIILYPNDVINILPPHIKSFISEITVVDKSVNKKPSVWNCDYVSGGRIVFAPTGDVTPYHDAKVIYDAAKNGMVRALEAGMKKPLIFVRKFVDFPDGDLVSILGALEAFYVPLQIRELKPDAASKFLRLGLYREEHIEEYTFEKVVISAIALERSRIIARDIGGSDPERMSPPKIVEYIKNVFIDDPNVKIDVVDKMEDIEKDYPLLHAVSRASIPVKRHQPRVVKLVYKPADMSRVHETIMLVGKGVTYDTGGADLKISGKMSGMSRDKCGAAAITGFIKACAILKPPYLKAVAYLCLCRNSIGENSYVADEILVSKSGKTIRVTNTDAEGRLAMADALYELTLLAEQELNPHIYTIATLTGHARVCYGNFIASMDNHSAKATKHSQKLQFSGSRVGEELEVSNIRPEDLTSNEGVIFGDDLIQVDMKKTQRHHQLAGGFLMKVSGLDEKNVKYTHMDIAGAAGAPPDEPTAVPILTLCHAHKVIL